MSPRIIIWHFALRVSISMKVDQTPSCVRLGLSTFWRLKRTECVWDLDKGVLTSWTSAENHARYACQDL